MTKEELKQIQEVQMQIMDDIHRVCVENKLRYYLIGGSALGAIRHNGIIPWDVDIDIAMPRKDYERFVTVESRKLKSRYQLHSYETDKHYSQVHAIVVLKDSCIKFRNEGGDGLRHGIFVDVLPLDQWPDNKSLILKQQSDLQRIQFARSLVFGVKYASNSPLKGFIKTLSSKVFSLFVSKHWLNKKQHDIMKRHDTPDEGTFWCSMVSHYSFEKKTYPKTYFGDPRLHDFSGRQFFVPTMVEEYLTHLFGDYMKCPSLESQQKQINSVVYASWIDSNGQKIEIENY